MKSSIFIAIVCSSLSGLAQSKIAKSIPVESGQELLLQFDYPDLIKVTTWDKKEISIAGEVSINWGANDDAFELQTRTEGKTIVVKNVIKNLKNLPQRITVYKGEEKMMFNSQSDYKQFKREHPGEFDIVKWGVDMKITLEIKVPEGMKTIVESTYGMVEVANFSAPLSVIAKYGGVDAALNEPNVGELVAETSFGQIYSNLDTKFEGSDMQEKDFHMLVSSKPGSGPRYDFESKYGNVYLRKENGLK